jgi:hypothetical protein
VEQFWVLAGRSPQTLGNYILENWCHPSYVLDAFGRTDQACDEKIAQSARSDQEELQGLYHWLKDLAYYAGGVYAESLANVEQTLTEFAKTDIKSRKFVLAATGWTDMEQRGPCDLPEPEPFC